MLKKVISGWNAAPGAPEGWDPARDGECGALPIRIVCDDGGHLNYVESAWEPTPGELAALKAGGSVVLRVFGWQPPVALYVEPRDQVEPLPPQQDNETTDPEIVITVRRKVNGQKIEARRIVCIHSFMPAWRPGAIVEGDINAMLIEVGYDP